MAPTWGVFKLDFQTMQVICLGFSPEDEVWVGTINDRLPLNGAEDEGTANLLTQLQGQIVSYIQNP